MPDRITLSRAKGWRMPPDTVKVDRTTKWGNPYRVGDPGIPDAEVAVYRFRLWLLHSEAGMRLEKEARTQLRGKNLACWCKPGQPCHADVLLRLANP